MKTKILVLDNYDSFVYNLVHIIKKNGYKHIDIVKNNLISINDVEKYDKILLSPGPGLPSKAGKMLEIIEKYHSSKSILGICLGHQAIGEFFNCKLKNLKHPLHGVSSQTKLIENDYLFNGIPKNIIVGHYHSWVIEENTNAPLTILAKDEWHNVMAIKHQKYDVKGFQFHPESIMTEYGEEMIINWLKK